MASRGELFDRLKCLSPAQFEEVLFLFEIDPSIIPSPFAGQSIRAIRVIQWLEQKQDGLERWERTLTEPAISSIREVQELFALLSVALGTLSEDDIQELTSMTLVNSI